MQPHNHMMSFSLRAFFLFEGFTLARRGAWLKVGISKDN
jgi:hypothetical protein